MSREYPEWDEAIVRARFPGYTIEIAEVLASLKGPGQERRLIEKVGIPNLEGADVTLPEIGDTPEGKLASEHAVRDWISAIRRYEREVNALSTPESRSTLAKIKSAEKSKRDATAARDDEVRFFNHPSADLNKGFWWALATWTPAEAAAISLGKDPKFVNPKNLTKEIHGPSLFKEEFEARLERIKRALEAGILDPERKHVGKRNFEPANFLAWAKKESFPMWEKNPSVSDARPDISSADQVNEIALVSAINDLQSRLSEQELVVKDLRRQLGERDQQITRLQQPVDELNPKAATSLRRLCLGLARRHYWDQKNRRIKYQTIENALKDFPQSLRLGNDVIGKIIDQTNLDLGEPLSDDPLTKLP